MRVTQRWERRFAAMGTDCHLVVIGGSPHLAAAGVAEVARLEALWSRFRPDSELSRINAAGGGRLSHETWALLTRGLVGRRLTGGRFDPFLGEQIRAVGYDRTFAELADRTVRAGSATRAVAQPVLDLDARRREVRLARGASIDSGGIGKGLGADLVSDLLMRSGAEACLVNLGGDLRVRGDRPGGPWQIGIANEGPGPELSVKLASGGLATSSLSRRRWPLADGGSAHHVIDPRTGRSLRGRWAGASIIAPSAWLAEVLAKAALFATEGAAAALVRRHRGGGLLQTPSGGKPHILS